MNSPRPVVLLLFILLRLTSGGVAQYPQPVFEHLSIDHGLSQNGVASILQDSRGFMWFGTLGGLNKYDGHHFTVYTHTSFDSTTLSDNAVFCLAEGRDGMLWIGTGNGLNRFDPSTETFTAYYHRATQPADSLSFTRSPPIRRHCAKFPVVASDPNLPVTEHWNEDLLPNE